LQNGVAIEAGDEKERTSLVWAAMNGQAASLKLLIGAGANIETVSAADGRTPLMTAVVNKHELAVQALIDAGAKLDVTDKDGETAMSLAKRKPCSMVILNLIQVGARKALKGPDSGAALRSEAGLQLRPSSGRDALPKSRDGALSGNGRGGGAGGSGGLGGSGAGGEAQVEEFLSFLGLEKYLPLFQDQGIDFNALVAMDENDLKGIGLKLFGPRRKISSAIKKWQEEQGGDDEVEQLVGGPDDEG
jgi:hypothetical protein